MKARARGCRVEKGNIDMSRVRARQIARLGGTMRVPMEQIGAYRWLQEVGYLTIDAEPGGKWYKIALTTSGRGFVS